MGRSRARLCLHASSGPAPVHAGRPGRLDQRSSTGRQVIRARMGRSRQHVWAKAVHRGEADFSIEAQTTQKVAGAQGVNANSPGTVSLPFVQGALDVGCRPVQGYPSLPANTRVRKLMAEATLPYTPTLIRPWPMPRNRGCPRCPGSFLPFLSFPLYITGGNEKQLGFTWTPWTPPVSGHRPGPRECRGRKPGARLHRASFPRVRSSEDMNEHLIQDPRCHIGTGQPAQ